MIDLIEAYTMGVSPSNVGSLVSLGAKLVITLQQGVIDASMLFEFHNGSLSYSIDVLSSLLDDITKVRLAGIMEPWMTIASRDAERILSGVVRLDPINFKDGVMALADLRPQDQKRFKELLNQLKDWQLWINRSMSQPRQNTSKMSPQDLAMVLHSQCSAILYNGGEVGVKAVSQAVFNPARDVARILHYLSLSPSGSL